MWHMSEIFKYLNMLNNKSGLNRLFPFAKKKPNIPSKLTDKFDIKSSKQKLDDEKSNKVIKISESVRSDILIESNEKTKPLIEKSIDETLSNIQSKSPEKYSSNIESPKLKNNDSISLKKIDESDFTLENIKKPKENYQRWNIPFSSKFKGKDFDKTLLTMQDLIYYNPVTNPIVKDQKVLKKDDKNADDPDGDLMSISEESVNKTSTSNNCITPCIKVGADGKIIIDQETLMLNETGLEEKREELAKSKVIEESGFQSHSYSYKRKREPSKQWTKDETLRFYKCLMNLGTDFSMIQQYFPGRTRAQIKRKYKTEERKNPQLINGALTNSTHYDSVLIENMFQDDEPDVIESISTIESNVSIKPIKEIKSRKRRHNNVTRAKCGRMSVCAYMMEEEIVLKKKRNVSKKTLSASSLKNEILELQSLKKTKKHVPKSKFEVVNNLNSEEGEKTEIITSISDELRCKVRTLQDFHEEYKEDISKFEDIESD
ncbi:transcription factor TFIIIB component B'' homolog [Daktulosphaira vitifoliae]|uniref:transcription factor TFIIIB component B'' homolog n=1 Tax=Daktulosphaira vitifoliae TaxID=58002 RepID=UPI0021AA81D2|nr:transcription factor TFIIIB component B'' homolog [Daktulosphaira vitifoliae]